MPASQRLLFCALFRECRLFTRSLKGYVLNAIQAIRVLIYSQRVMAALSGELDVVISIRRRHGPGRGTGWGRGRDDFKQDQGALRAGQGRIRWGQQGECKSLLFRKYTHHHVAQDSSWCLESR